MNKKNYKVGPDEFSSWDLETLPDDYEWMIYYYEYESYDGHGTCVVKINDEQYMVLNLGHCSCFGPLDDQANDKEIISAKACYSHMSDWASQTSDEECKLIMRQWSTIDPDTALAISL